jgi:molybdenum cofactor synthesis domain-containing protein
MSEPIKHRPVAAVLAVGTEITTGQISNSNAMTLSQRLTDMGFEVGYHLCVPDEREMILSALNYLQIRAQLILITGGLGPTSDDFTREVVADWFEEQLVWNEAAWQRILDRLNGLGVAVAESNRQQCYFPRTAEVLPNSAGTASGFMLGKAGYPFVTCLPGPPREIDAIWHEHLIQRLREGFALPMPEKLMRWQCIGKSESSLGEIVEGIVAGSNLKTGYRPHVPYVEIKLWVPARPSDLDQQHIQRLDSALAPWTVAKDDDDLAEIFWRKTQSIRMIKIEDSASAGMLGRRILEMRARLHSLDLPPICIRTAQDHEAQRTKLESQELFIHLAPHSDLNSWLLGLTLDGNMRSKTISIAYRPAREQRDRFHRMLVELALYHINLEMPVLTKE